MNLINNIINNDNDNDNDNDNVNNSGRHHGHHNINIDYDEKIKNINDSFLMSLEKYKQCFILYYKNINSQDNSYKNNYESIKMFIEEKMNELKNMSNDIKNTIQDEISKFSNINLKLDKEKKYYLKNNNTIYFLKNDYNKSKVMLKNSKFLFKTSYIIYLTLIVGILILFFLIYKLFNKYNLKK